jgi:hypothetical protein
MIIPGAPPERGPDGQMHRRIATTPDWALGGIYRDRRRALHRWGWSSEIIESARLEEIQRIRRLIQGIRTVPRATSPDWD